MDTDRSARRPRRVSALLPALGMWLLLAAIHADPAHALLPGWAACNHDNECQSNWCGCNGGSTKVCLPNTSYPKQCPSWINCDHDNECGSNWCGCNGGGTKQCLPDKRYQKSCTGWVQCDHDEECQSNWCGCNGTGTKVCLPNTSYPKACAGWVLCDHDNECQSNWCGCNGTGTKACLPNTSYPKACAGWTRCDADNECQSSWCGCNGGALKTCLPNTSYSKTCQDPTVWPNSLSNANSDGWITDNQTRIRQMNVRVLAINFVNSTATQTNAPNTQANMISLLSNRTCSGTACSIFDGLKLGSKYHGYSSSSAPAFLNYTLAYAVDLSDKGAPPPGWYHNNSSKYPIKCVGGDNHQFNYAALFNSTFATYFNIHDDMGNLLNLAQAIQKGLVNEVFIYVNGNPTLPDQFNACTSDAQCATGRVCDTGAGVCRTSDRYQCPSGGPLMSDFQLPETLEWKAQYDASGRKVLDGAGNLTFDPSAGNGVFDADEYSALQTVGRSIRFLYVNSTRGPGCAIHSLGHSVEASNSALPELDANFEHFANFDLDARGFVPNPPFDSWYGCPDPGCLTFTGANALNWSKPPLSGSMNPYNQGCGNVHFPPNATHAYDDTNTFQVYSTCENYGLHNGTGGQDAQQLINNAKWHSLNASQGVVYDTVADDCQGGWQIYWRQSFPGYGNTATGSTASGTSNGIPIKSWWPYLFY